jgi:hypothetical protein
MHAFDYLVTLFSFVFAMAIGHVLATVGDMVVASRRLTFSWLNAGWMLVVLLAVIAWWLGIWDLRKQGSWPTVTIGLFFCAACGLYVTARIACPRIAPEGHVDLREFHLREGPKYMIGYGLFSVFTVGTNTYFGMANGATSTAGSWLSQNAAIVPMAIAGFAAGMLPDRRVQATALATVLAMWVWYFWGLQGALTG